MPDEIAKDFTAVTIGKVGDEFMTSLLDSGADVAWHTLERRAGHEPTLVEELEHKHESGSTLGHGASAFDRVVGEEAVRKSSPPCDVAKTVKTAADLKPDPIPETPTKHR